MNDQTHQVAFTTVNDGLLGGEDLGEDWLLDMPLPVNNGSWTVEEVEYMLKLIEAFNAGVLTGLAEGTRLRSFLAQRLSCKPKRISKRLEGVSHRGIGYNGRQTYRSRSVLDPASERQIHENLGQMEWRYLQSGGGASGAKPSRSNKKLAATPGASKTKTTAASALKRRLQDGRSNDKAPQVSAVTAMLNSMPKKREARDDGPKRRKMGSPSSSTSTVAVQEGGRSRYDQGLERFILQAPLQSPSNNQTMPKVPSQLLKDYGQRRQFAALQWPGTNRPLS